MYLTIYRRIVFIEVITRAGPRTKDKTKQNPNLLTGIQTAYTDTVLKRTQTVSNPELRGRLQAALNFVGQGLVLQPEKETLRLRLPLTSVQRKTPTQQQVQICDGGKHWLGWRAEAVCAAESTRANKLQRDRSTATPAEKGVSRKKKWRCRCSPTPPRLSLLENKMKVGEDEIK